MRRPLLIFVLAIAFATPVPGLAQPAPPLVERVLDADSVVVAGSADVWRMRYFEADALENPWIEVEDPYGGRIHIPSMYYLAIASDLTAFVEGTMLRSVFFVRRPLMLPVALVFLVGLVTSSRSRSGCTGDGSGGSPSAAGTPTKFAAG
jgi:hypothetical protein